MRKMTLYLPDELKVALERYAKERGTSEAVVVREALAAVISSAERPKPRLPLTGQALGDPSLAERVDELLEGFGES
jgi:hypothetical protein